MTARKQHHVPKLRHHKASGQGFVELTGERFYLGRFDLPETQKRYHQKIAEWLAAGRKLPVAPEDITLVELIDRNTAFARGYYVRGDGTQTNEFNNICQALKPVKELYGHVRAIDFGPLALRAVREKMISKGWCRTHINKQVDRVRRMFRWATEQELIPGNVYQALRAVDGLRHGRSEARESESVRPVPQDRIDAIKPHVSRQVWAMIQLQLLTAARAGEICLMRPKDIDRTGRVWLYEPTSHKTAHHGHRRIIYIGPKAQEILRPFLLRTPDTFCFSPKEAEGERRRAASEKRQTPLSCGNRPGTNKKKTPMKCPGDQYTTASYGKAITKACDTAFQPPKPLCKREGESLAACRKRLTAAQRNQVAEWNKAHRWHSHQLRHNAATSLRREYGLDIARVVLGHRSPTITETYAEIDKTQAVDAMLRVG